MTRFLLALPLALLPVSASAGDVSLGVTLGGALDLPDKASGDHTRFGPAGTLSIPVRVELAPSAWFVARLRADVGTGHDRVSWLQPAGEDAPRLAASEHWAMLGAGGLTLGLEGRVPTDGSLRPFAGFGVGGAFVGTWHSFGVSDSGVDTTVLLDPEQNDLSDPNNVDPYATGITLLTDIYGGVAVPASDTVEVTAEIGYSVAFLPSAELKKATPGIDARRDAFGWNTLRLQVGASFTF